MPNSNLLFTGALASTLADFGVNDACVSPGSRNSPLIAGFAAETRIRKWPLLDERSAGFFALGLAKATGRPVVLACTSGTAAAEYHAAVAEASQSNVPLLLLTADRPAELRGVGAPQTIDQIDLYGRDVRLFVDAPPPDEATTERVAVELARQAWTAAVSVRPGPVHLNLPFREPLLDSSAAPGRQRTSQAPSAEPHIVGDLGGIVTGISARRGLIVVGQSNEADLPEACSRLAAAAGYPVIADPLSGLRHGTHSLDLVLGNGDALVAAGVLDHLVPDLIIRFGPVPTSKPVWAWLGAHPDTEQILVDIEERDTTHSAASVVTLPGSVAADQFTNAITASAPASWTEHWLRLDQIAAAATQRALRELPFPNEPAIARCIIDNVVEGSLLTVGSSMPIRDIDTYGGKSSRQIRLYGNRGANGIDGVVSAALGTAASGDPATVLVGDVSLFHDLNALGTATQLDLPLTIVVIHNDGGGIFHFLPQHDPGVLDPEVFETYLATPHGTDFVAIAAACGMPADRVEDVATLIEMVSHPPSGPRLIELRTDRSQNLAAHRYLMAAVADEIAAAVR